MRTTRPRIAIVQVEHDADDPAENLAELMAAVERYRDRDLVVFPELALHGHHVTTEPPGEVRRAVRATPEEDVAAFHEFVRGVRARVVYGEVVERDGKLLNLATFTDGETRVSYAKTHVHWTEPFSPGDEFPVVDTPFGRVGMLICFDAAFPEVPRILALAGAQIIVNISAIPEHFPLAIVHRRLQAASVENQVYTVFSNRRGDGFKGGSAVVDPLGDLVGVAGENDPALEVTLDMDRLTEWRSVEPLLVHRRPQLYARIADASASVTHATGQPTTPKYGGDVR